MLSGKPWKLESMVFLLAGVFSCFFLANLLAYVFKFLPLDLMVEDRKFFGNLVASLGLQFASLVLAHIFLRKNETTWAEFIGVRGSVTALLARGLAVAALILPVALTLNQISDLVITAIQSSPAELQPSMQVLKLSRTPLRQALFSFSAVVMAPLVEEIFFRGVLYAAIKERGHPHLALWGTSIFFALIHGSLMAFVPLIFVAIALTLLYERTGRLLAPIIAHAAFNAANVFFSLRHGM